MPASTRSPARSVSPASAVRGSPSWPGGCSSPPRGTSHQPRVSIQGRTTESITRKDHPRQERHVGRPGGGRRMCMSGGVEPLQTRREKSAPARQACYSDYMRTASARDTFVERVFWSRKNGAADAVRSRLSKMEFTSAESIVSSSIDILRWDPVFETFGAHLPSLITPYLVRSEVAWFILRNTEYLWYKIGNIITETAQWCWLRVGVRSLLLRYSCIRSRKQYFEHIPQV